MDISWTKVATAQATSGSSASSLVVLPTYNEAGNLAPLVQRILRHPRFDVLVVDDNSPDGTGEIAEALHARFPRRVAVEHGTRKRGLGAAYLHGFERALQGPYAYIFQMDADFSHNPDDLPSLRAALADADVVLGSRYTSGGRTRDWPRWRHALSRAGSVYASRVLNLPLHDLTSGFKGFRRDVLETLDLSGIRSVGYAFQIEVTYRCARQGYRIVERPIVFQNRQTGRSKMHIGIVVEALTVCWALRFGDARPAHEEALT